VLSEDVTVRHMLYLFGPGVILLAVISLGFVVMSILRGRSIPRCFECGAVKVRPSPPLGFLDLAAALFQIRAYRCEGCRARFHAVSLFTRSAL
jgi:hypothetical protein